MGERADGAVDHDAWMIEDFLKLAGCFAAFPAIRYASPRTHTG